MKYWFTADTHFGHKNIIKYCNRPFATLDAMDNTIIRNWNARVDPDDTVFVLGDFCFRNSPGGKLGEGTQNKASFYSDKLNGTKIFLCGNHDKNNSVKSLIRSMTIRHGGYDIYLIHNPEDYKPNELNFCGHVHDKWKFKALKDKTIIVNVGVDVWKFMPVTINEIIEKLAAWKKWQKP